MKQFILCLFICLIMLSCSQKQKHDLLITNVNVVDVKTGDILKNRTLAIDSNLISAVYDPEVNSIYSDQVLDCAGKYVLPGFWDMHVHIFNNLGVAPPDTWYFPLMVANGITGVRDMWTRPNEQMDSITKWRKQFEEGSFIGPRIQEVGTLVEGSPRIWRGFNSDSVVNSSEAKAFVHKIKDSGIDFVKVYSSLSKEAYDALVEEALRTGLDIAGHVPNSVSLVYASNKGQKSIEHITDFHSACSSWADSLGIKWVSYENLERVTSTYDKAKADSLFKTMAKNKTWNCPTLAIEKFYYGGEPLSEFENDERLKYIPKKKIEKWNRIAGGFKDRPLEYQKSFTPLFKGAQKMVKRMSELGVPILAGTDLANPYIYPGFSLLDEILEIKEAGLTNLEALQTATLNPAVYFGKLEYLGTVEPGKYADLVILKENPLNDISNVKSTWATIINGKLYDRTTLDGLLKASEK